MTTLGKILAIVNLVFSLFVGWLLVMNYAARTNWHAAFVEADKQLKAARQDARAANTEAEQARGELAKVSADLAGADRRLAEAKAGLELQVAALNKQLNDEKGKVKERDASLTGIAQEIKGRQQEVDYLKSLVATRDTQIKSMEKNVEDMRNRAVEMEIAAKSEQDRNNNLLAQIERLNKALQKAAQNGTALASNGAGKRNPPSEDVEGTVKSTDPQSGFVTLSVGSDQGLNKGNTLEVYRLKPDAAYLGTIEILAVHPNEAVGKPVSRLRGPIQVGDRVSSNILTRR